MSPVGQTPTPASPLGQAPSPLSDDQKLERGESRPPEAEAETSTFSSRSTLKKTTGQSEEHFSTRNEERSYNDEDKDSIEKCDKSKQKLKRKRDKSENESDEITTSATPKKRKTHIQSTTTKRRAEK